MEHGGDVLRPIIPVTLSWKDKKIKYEVLIDSGSDNSFFDWEIGNTLGLDLQVNGLQEVYGLGGKLSLYYPHPIMVTVGDFSYTLTAGFTPKMSGGILPPCGIVGQNGFFDQFKVVFDLKNNTIEINPYSE